MARLDRLADNGAHMNAEDIRQLVAESTALKERFFAENAPILLEVGALLGDGADKVIGVGIPEAVYLHILADTLTESFFANKVFEHTQNGAAFLVSDRVEGCRDIVVGLDRLANSPCIGQAVCIHGSQG